MSKETPKLFFGFAAGMAAGLLLARAFTGKRGMPNAKSWQKILDEEYGQIEAAALIARAQGRYNELVSQSGVFENKALQIHLLEIILPMLALYQAWRADGLDQDSALAKVDALYEAQYRQNNKGFLLIERMLGTIPGSFGIFKRLVGGVMKSGFPAPGFDVRFIGGDAYHFGFDIHRCFYQDIVTHFGAPELGASFCKVDDITMKVLPEQIQWRRSGTLGMGASHCDFRWEYIPDTIISVDQVD